MKSLIFFSVLLCVTNVFAQQPGPCPDAEKLEQFCSSVGGLEPDDEVASGPTYRYYYQRQVFEASCVVPGDPVDIRNRKIAQMWKRFEDKELTCNNLQFDVVNGSVIKYAASRGIDSFMRDVTQWGIDLDKIDKSDNRTILDYVQVKLERAKGGSLERTYRFYYDILRKAGARHRHEIE